MSRFSYAELSESQWFSLWTPLLLEVKNALIKIKSVRSALTKANLPADSFIGHSFCIEAAATAASADICDSSIQSLGC